MGALAFIFTFSASFEIIEWCVARIVDPDAGEAYLGKQGDVSDTEKGLALAGLGALHALGATLRVLGYTGLAGNRQGNFFPDVSGCHK